MDKYIIALYLRLSLDDSKTQSVSIETQRKILQAFVDSLEIPNAEIIEFVDNGYSGTNFERPKVQELLDLVRSFKINCIIVKDFSRFGRNSIEVGYFTQQVFPLFNVRFISVSDNFDSDNYKGDTGGLAVAFKYLVNECYSRDLSRKTKTAKYSKMRRGEYNSGTYCYGYIRGEDGGMEIDSYAADIVRMIFNLSAEGKTSTDISKMLFDKGIPTPAQHKAKRGIKTHDISRCCYWSQSTILRMLANEQYTGMFVMCKARVADVGSRKILRNDESKWIKIPNHHPAIISQELYDKVQAKRLTFKQPNYKTHIYPLKHKVFCGCCQHSMSRRNKKPRYVCETTRYHTKPHPCFDTEITEEILHNMLFQIISKQAQLILNIDDVSNLDKLQLQTEHTIEMQNRIEELKSKKQRLYEQLLMREIELPEYQSEKEKYNEMLKAIQPLYDKSLKATERMKIDAKTRAETVQLAKDIAKENTLTQTLSDMLIDKVLIYPDKRLEVSWKVQDFCREM